MTGRTGRAARRRHEDIAIRSYMYKELTGCKEYTGSYPNLELWEKYYGSYAEDEE